MFDKPDRKDVELKNKIMLQNQRGHQWVNSSLNQITFIAIVSQGLSALAYYENKILEVTPLRSHSTNSHPLGGHDVSC